MKVIGQDIKEIAKEINEGKIVAIPTETVYGLAIKFDDLDLIKKLCDLKERDAKIFTMMIANKDDIQNYAILSEKAVKIVEEYMPGELTLVLPINPLFDNEYFKGQDGTIGIRIPNHELMLNVLKETGPLLVTSANKSGMKDCMNSDEVASELKEVDVIVEGAAGGAKPSTVLKIIDEVEVIRQGDLIIN